MESLKVIDEDPFMAGYEAWEEYDIYLSLQGTDSIVEWHRGWNAARYESFDLGKFMFPIIRSYFPPIDLEVQPLTVT